MGWVVDEGMGGGVVGAETSLELFWPCAARRGGGGGGGHCWVIWRVGERKVGRQQGRRQAASRGTGLGLKVGRCKGVSTSLS